jgi:hypothetical protein
MKMLQRRLDGYWMEIWSLIHNMHCEGVSLLSWDLLGCIAGLATPLPQPRQAHPVL